MSARRKVPLEAWSHGAEMVEILNLADLDLIMNAQLGVARHWQDHHIWSPPLGVQPGGRGTSGLSLGSQQAACAMCHPVSYEYPLYQILSSTTLNLARFPCVVS